MTTKLPREIEEQVEIIAEHARREGLDFYPTLYVLLTAEQISQVAAYGGFPQRYPHWRFGMEYERLRKSHKYGLSRIYEMVINNDPCYAYLLNDNLMVDHKTVIAHVYGHGDFFKNNIWFSKTNRKMIDEMANHATRVRRYVERYGVERVEKMIDTCLALENLVDPHSVFIRREKEGKPETSEEKETREKLPAAKYPAKSYMDRYINPPDRLARVKAKEDEEHKKARTRFPDKPVRDIMWFLLQNAPMEDWEADILAMIREEAYYFAPQGQTKIMNEGWASY